MNKFGSRSTRNIISSEFQHEKCLFWIFFGFFLGFDLVDYQPHHVFCYCTVLRDKAKRELAVEVEQKIYGEVIIKIIN